ncbi:MAG: hypothetical protein ACW98D_10240 [Promethearchaeota archaeon]|jgi:hypothetical protein
MLVPATTKKIEVTCPICKTRDLIGIPEKKINTSSHLTTISIQKGLICPHHFQVFIDKNSQVRGYQKVDFELNHDNSKEMSNGVKAFNRKREENGDHFKNGKLDSNSVDNESQYRNSRQENNDSKAENIEKPKTVTLKEIYEEFWEFIDEDNELFQNFIRNDKKRKTSSIDPTSNAYSNHLEINQEV